MPRSTPSTMYRFALVLSLLIWGHNICDAHRLTTTSSSGSKSNDADWQLRKSITTTDSDEYDSQMMRILDEVLTDVATLTFAPGGGSDFPSMEPSDFPSDAPSMSYMGDESLTPSSVLADGDESTTTESLPTPAPVLDTNEEVDDGDGERTVAGVTEESSTISLLKSNDIFGMTVLCILLLLGGGVVVLL